LPDAQLQLSRGVRVRVLPAGAGVSDPAGDVHRGRVPEDEDAVFVARVQSDHPEAALPARLPRHHHPRRILHLPCCMFQILISHCPLDSFAVVLQSDGDGGWPRTLMSAFYPLLLSGSSLVVCFWAEVRFLLDIFTHFQALNSLNKT